MNDGKICVSVCAGTADEMIAQIDRASNSADVVEIRLDCLDDPFSFDRTALRASEKPVIYTYRPKEQGGRTEAGKAARIDFWNTFIAGGSINRETDWIDLESDVRSEISDHKFQEIVSFHDFNGVPEDLGPIASSLFAGGGLAKIAVQVDEISDSIAVWKLLHRARSENRRVVPIAMGEPGKWTRILGLAHGAALTYASPGKGRETAPGQITAEDLAEVYRVRQLDRKTAVYGIVAGNTSYSMSPYMHNEAFRLQGLNSVFIPLEVSRLDRFMRRMVLAETRELELNFCGFAVTNPHKRNIIRYLDEMDDAARRIGAINTVLIRNGRLFGFNTDAPGFIEPLRSAYGGLSGTRIAVFGSGGAARACVYALKQDGAEVTVFARDPEKVISLSDEFEVTVEPADDLSDRFVGRHFEIVVNATPLGTKGSYEDDSILTAGQLGGVHLVYDLVYNPFETRLITEAEKAGVPAIGGLAMLTAQAAAQQRIWTGLEPPVKAMSAAAIRRLTCIPSS